MITIIHGDDISKSREFFLELKQKHKDSILLDGSKLSITDLVQNIEGSTLFGSTKTIFVEDFLTKNKKTSKESKEILNFMMKNSESSDFIFWESKEIAKRELSLFKNSTIKLFKLPKNIFLFLDNLKPNNSKNLLNLFHEALDSGIKEELILFMLQRQIRMLLNIAEPANGENIEEFTRLAPWQMEKLQRQAKLFDITTLKKIYRKLFNIEIGEKTGQLTLSLVQSIDFLLLEM